MTTPREIVASILTATERVLTFQVTDPRRMYKHVYNKLARRGYLADTFRMATTDGMLVVVRRKAER